MAANSNGEPCAEFSSLADDLVLQVAAFLPPSDLTQLESVSTYVSHLNTDTLWKNLCQHRWQHWPRYQLTPEKWQELESSIPRVRWKDRYRLTEHDVARTEITDEEIEKLGWYFNFTLGAGGLRGDTLQRCFFKSGLLFLEDYPPLPYEIKTYATPKPARSRWDVNGQTGQTGQTSTRQWLKIAHFPPHFISRLSESAEWLIANENVTFVSCDEKGTLCYTGRDFS